MPIGWDRGYFSLILVCPGQNYLILIGRAAKFLAPNWLSALHLVGFLTAGFWAEFSKTALACTSLRSLTSVSRVIWWKRNGNCLIAWNEIPKAESQCFTRNNRRLFQLKTRKHQRDTWQVWNEIHSWRPTDFFASLLLYGLHHVQPRVKSTEFVQRKKKTDKLNRRNYLYKFVWSRRLPFYRCWIDMSSSSQRKASKHANRWIKLPFTWLECKLVIFLFSRLTFFSLDLHNS